MKDIGFILYEGPSLIGDGNIVVIATLRTKNAKTGDMVQVWYLPQEQSPISAVLNNSNGHVCGTCPLQGQSPDGKSINNRVCYVDLGKAPRGIYLAYKRGRYQHFVRSRDEDLLRGRKIRLGAYGDPAAGPTSIVRYLTKISAGWTGYSHQLFWIDKRRANALAKYLMVSCHTKAMHAEAIRRGWRAFTVISERQTPPTNAVQCPYYTHGVTCRSCLFCQGTNKQAKSVYVLAHSVLKANLPVIQQAEA